MDLFQISEAYPSARERSPSTPGDGRGYLAAVGVEMLDSPHLRALTFPTRDIVRLFVCHEQSYWVVARRAFKIFGIVDLGVERDACRVASMRT